jgi:uncharacterized membrane protein
MEEQKHPKQDFQVERLAFFSDAVFAIAITLLVIDFKVPPLTMDSTYQSVWEQLTGYWPNFFGLLMSFFLISMYWIRHHDFFKYIHNYNRQVVVMNLVMLLPIIFLPFTTSFMAQSSLYQSEVFVLAFQVYSLNHILIIISMLAFYILIFAVHKKYSYEMPLKEKTKFVSNSIFALVIFSAIFIASFHSLHLLKYGWVYIVASIPVKRLAERYYLKRHSPKGIIK